MALEIVIATGNKGKLKEIMGGFQMYAPQIKCIPMHDLADIYGPPPKVPETENTYIGNANLKGDAFFKWARGERNILCDDSGIRIDALDGAPGVITADYVSKRDPTLTEVLGAMKDIEDIKDPHRTAAMDSLLLFKQPGKKDIVVTSELGGRLLVNPVSEAEGFGFDPWFVPDGQELTNAEIKKQVGAEFLTHRLKSVKKLVEILAQDR